MNVIQSAPSQDSQQMLNSLKESVNKALVQKQKLGQYAVFWTNHQLLLEGDDAPSHSNHTKSSIHLDHC